MLANLKALRTAQGLSQRALADFVKVSQQSINQYENRDTEPDIAVLTRIADYFGVVDGQPHTVTVSDLSEAGVTTAIRYGHSADACTLTSAPNYTEAGDYPVYYEITYTYHDTDMVEDLSLIHI